MQIFRRRLIAFAIMDERSSYLQELKMNQDFIRKFSGLPHSNIGIHTQGRFVNFKTHFFLDKDEMYTGFLRFSIALKRILILSRETSQNLNVSSSISSRYFLKFLISTFWFMIWIFFTFWKKTFCLTSSIFNFVFFFVCSISQCLKTFSETLLISHTYDKIQHFSERC